MQIEVTVMPVIPRTTTTNLLNLITFDLWGFAGVSPSSSPWSLWISFVFPGCPDSIPDPTSCSPHLESCRLCSGLPPLLTHQAHRPCSRPSQGTSFSPGDPRGPLSPPSLPPLAPCLCLPLSSHALWAPQVSCFFCHLTFHVNLRSVVLNSYQANSSRAGLTFASPSVCQAYSRY